MDNVVIHIVNCKLSSRENSEARGSSKLRILKRSCWA